MDGWLKLFRQLTEWEHYADKNTFKLFMHFLLTANIKDAKYMGQTIPRGSLVIQEEKVGERNGLTRQEVRTSIKKLLKSGEITKNSTNKFTVINLVNFNVYQCSDDKRQPTTNQQSTSNQPTANQQSTSIEEERKKERIKNKRIKNKRSLLSELPTAVEDGENENISQENETRSGTMLDEIGSMAVQTCTEAWPPLNREVLEQQIDTESKSGEKRKARRKAHYEHDSPYYRSALWLASKIENRIPGYKKHTEAQIQTWADSVRLMLETDKRDKDIANKLLLFSQEDEFWRKNILSMPKFREQFDKLLVRYHERGREQENNSSQVQRATLETGYVKLADLVKRTET